MCLHTYFRPKLLRQPDLPHQFGKAWVGTQRIEIEVRLQPLQLPISLLISCVEPPKGLIFVSHVGVKSSNYVRRTIAQPCALLGAVRCLSSGSLPARGKKSLFHARGDISSVSLPISCAYLCSSIILGIYVSPSTRRRDKSARGRMLGFHCPPSCTRQWLRRIAAPSDERDQTPQPMITDIGSSSRARLISAIASCSLPPMGTNRLGIPLVSSWHRWGRVQKPS